MYFLICSNVDDDIINFEVCRFMVNTKVYKSRERYTAFPIIKKFINCTLKAILQQKNSFSEEVTSGGVLWKWVLQVEKNRMCQIMYFMYLYWWMLIRDPMNGKTEIYRLSCSVLIFKCFKWEAFRIIFYMKNKSYLTFMGAFTYYAITEEERGSLKCLRMIMAEG